MKAIILVDLSTSYQLYFVPGTILITKGDARSFEKCCTVVRNFKEVLFLSDGSSCMGVKIVFILHVILEEVQSDVPGV